MPKARDNSLLLFRNTGLMSAGLMSLYLVTYHLENVFALNPDLMADLNPPMLIFIGVSMILFLVSALNEPLYWIQPILMLIMTPVPMLKHASSMFSLGTFIAAVIMLFRLGFFEQHKIGKFVLVISYFYLCEVLVGLTSGSGVLDIVVPILFTTIFLIFLMLVYRDKWIVYLNRPKPALSLAVMGITKTESEYLKAFLEGKSFKEIAINAGVKESTVRNTLARVYKKFKVPDKSTLMAKCEKYSIIE